MLEEEIQKIQERIKKSRKILIDKQKKVDKYNEREINRLYEINEKKKNERIEKERNEQEERKFYEDVKAYGLMIRDIEDGKFSEPENDPNYEIFRRMRDHGLFAANDDGKLMCENLFEIYKKNYKQTNQDIQTKFSDMF